MTRSTVRFAFVLAGLLTAPLLLWAQGGRGGNPEMTRGNQLDVAGKTAEARAVFQKIHDTATDEYAKSQALRAIAMSYAFDGDCANTVKYEEMVIKYWMTREAAEPQNAFYQEGEMANEAARVCIDNGQFDIAEEFYRRGTDYGLREPEPRTHPKTLWQFRLTHALGRLAARRGNAVEARKYVAEARRILDSDAAMAPAQERFYPYLQGYVELYLNNNKEALDLLLKNVATTGNTTDPYFHALVGMAYEKLRQTDKAKEFYTKAYDLATAHNPPAAFTRPFAAKKLGK